MEYKKIKLKSLKNNPLIGFEQLIDTFQIIYNSLLILGKL